MLHLHMLLEPQILREDMELKSLALAYHQGPDLRANKGENRYFLCLDLSCLYIFYLREHMIIM